MLDNGRQAQSLIEVGQVLTMVGHTDQAITVTNQALRIANAIPDDDGSKVETLSKATQALLNGSWVLT
jgi:hypothetical protein